ncbi:MAG: phytanoyl-CoA dioxygenase family protein [Paracoccaceae bacterium]|nr:phytanoyl-CoA dioxygenase family protein [Paracoccaceae bacterium]
MKYQQNKQEFETQGFTVIRGFLDPDFTHEIREAAERFNREIIPKLQEDFGFFEDRARPDTLRQVNNMYLHDDYFRALFNHFHWTECASQLLSEDVQCVGMQWFDKPVGTTHETPPHQDDASLSTVNQNALAMWVALDPVDEGNGCLRYIPGSHLEGYRHHVTKNATGFSRRIDAYSESDRQREYPVVMKPGDLVVHHPLTIHRADANRSQYRRRSFLQLYQGVSCEIDARRYSEYIEDLQRIRRDLGLEEFAFAGQDAERADG